MPARFMVYDRWGAQLGAIQVPLAAKRTREVSGSDRLDLTCVDSLEKDQRIVTRDTKGRWCEYVVVDVRELRNGNARATTAYCENSVSELSRKFVVEKEGRGYTPAAALLKALEGTRWTPGSVDAAQAKDVSFYHVSALQAVEDVANVFGLEIETEIGVVADKVVSRKVGLKARRGADNGKRFTYSKDLSSVKRVVNSDDVVTRLYGYGKGLGQADSDGNATGGYTRKITFGSVNGGKDYVQDDEALQLWGMLDAEGNLLHAEGMADFPECEDAAELLVLTKAELDERKEPRVTYECDAVALDMGGLGHEGIDVGDTVQIVDTEFSPKLRLSGRITKLEEDLLDGAGAVKATIGNVYETMTDRMAKNQAATQKMWSQSGAWSDAAGARPGYIEQVIGGLNYVMNSTGGYVYMEPGEGITVYDKPKDQNPTMAIQLNGAGFRIANSKKSNGEWDWRTFGTGNGFTADEITAGTIQGGSNYWNLSTGDLLFKQGKIADAKGKSEWNLTTGAFTAKDITANGTFTSKSSGRLIKLVDGALSACDATTGSIKSQVYLQNNQVFLNSYGATACVDAYKTYGSSSPAAGIMVADNGCVYITAPGGLSMNNAGWGFNGTKTVVTGLTEKSDGLYAQVADLHFINGILC